MPQNVLYFEEKEGCHHKPYTEHFVDSNEPKYAHAFSAFMLCNGDISKGPKNVSCHAAKSKAVFQSTLRSDLSRM